MKASEEINQLKAQQHEAGEQHEQSPEEPGDGIPSSASSRPMPLTGALFGLPPLDEPLPNEVYWAHMVPEEIRRGVESTKDALSKGREIHLVQRVIRPDGNWDNTHGIRRLMNRNGTIP
jgi:hypothetical protein